MSFSSQNNCRIMRFPDKILKFVNKGNKRSVRAKKNIILMFVLRGISILCGFLIVPLTINYVSSYEYGIWLTISSLVAWLSFFDIGIGNGLRNRFTEAVEGNDPVAAKTYVSTAYAIITLIVGCVWLIAMVASNFLNWSKILNAYPALNKELLYTVLIVITNFSILFVLGLNKTLLNALQKPAFASAFDTLSQVFLCAVLLIITHISKGNLVNLALAMGGTSIGVLVIANIWTFKTILKDYRPSVRFVKFRYAKDIMSLGINFFFLQILAIAFYQTNNLIISHYIGPEEVTIYNIAFKYMQVLPMAFTIILTPFWSAFTEAKVNEDYPWMITARKRLIQVLIGFGVLGLVMVAVSPFVYSVWIKDVVIVPFAVTVMVYVYQMVNMWGTLWTQLLAGLGKIRLQLICSSVCCLLYVPICCYFCNIFGLIGLLAVSIVLPLICNSWFGVIQTSRILNKTATGIWNK